MSLNKNLYRYYAHHILAHFRISPSPSSPAEVQHLFDNFKKIGNLEYFRVPRVGTAGRFSSHCFVLFNPVLERSLVTPFTIPDQEVLVPKSNSFTQRLQSLIAIPRYSYIENDQSYLANKSYIPFKYSMSKAGLDLDKKYDISNSKYIDQFCYVSPNPSATEQLLREAELSKFRREVRHNFQKFHKFSSIEITSGIEAVNSLGTGIISEESDPKTELKVEDMMNLSSDK
ncbi:hypothetical protein CLIB1423_10S05116 [[Candida] railenensis]|uniref:Uncharacterized protein n=1 Tax=[Candida] railenensis TaxID=45579 RepID=A0A9P0QRV1_9ASCO|nr:hypothetical protein CLIB1423_10S05116 [[Candida] railenensis]